MNSDQLTHNWLRFFMVAFGLPFLMYFVNLLILHDHFMAFGQSDRTTELLFGIWLVAMWVTFPDSVGLSSSEPAEDQDEFSVRFIASATGSPAKFYSDISVKELPKVDTDIGLSDPDLATSEIVLGKVMKVIPLSHETDEGSTQAVLVQVDSTGIEMLKKFGWTTAE